ncbi:Cardiolipin synthase [Mycoplasmopsis glycophila]|uniref:Cardiolipin synthase n=2 Tax=Mycoplasmopsis glycophila TaxID=171285 RepID=A0A449AV80_9BACT|nr:Cardiolipin synthase [Mycoplasmopsis glycophila]
MQRINVLYNWFFLVFLYVINVVFVFIIYYQKRQTNAKISWIYLILLFPVIGHILFLTFGLIFVNKNEIKILKRKSYDLKKYPELIRKNNSRFLDDLSKINNGVVLAGNIELFPEGYRFYEVLIDQIKNAQKSIFIVSYIIKKSEISEEIMSLLTAKLEEGVEIKWLVDDFGCTFSQKRALNKLAKKGAQIAFIGKIYYPLIHSKSFSRNHQKFVIVDSEIVFSGGNNISDEYASLSKKYGHWIDLNYMIQGAYVNSYNMHFMQFWEIVTNQKIEIDSHINSKIEIEQKNKNNLILVSDSPSLDYSEAEFFWLKMISDAKEEIMIATPYLSLTNSLEKQIILALKRGVKIKIFIPGLPDKKMVYKVTLQEAQNLMNHGLELYIFKNSFLHTKMGVIDQKVAWVGTNNMDSRSMFSQYETMDVFEGEQVNEVVQIFNWYKQFSIHFQRGDEIMPNRTFFNKFLANWTKPLI